MRFVAAALLFSLWRRRRRLGGAAARRRRPAFMAAAVAMAVAPYDDSHVMHRHCACVCVRFECVALCIGGGSVGSSGVFVKAAMAEVAAASAAAPSVFAVLDSAAALSGCVVCVVAIEIVFHCDSYVIRCDLGTAAMVAAFLAAVAAVLCRCVRQRL